MKIVGYRSHLAQHEWGRRIGDVNYTSTATRTPVPVLVLLTDEGIEGVGIGAHEDIERIFPALDGEDPRSVVALYDRMCRYSFKLGHQGAVATTIGALDMALWDIKAKSAGEPLWRLLGGRDRFVPGYASALDAPLDDDALVAVHEEFAARGFSAVKLKGGRHLDRDLQRLRLVRDVYRSGGAEPALMLDANEVWHRSQAVRYIARLEQELDLTWIEEPVRRWDAAGLAAVRHGVRAGVASGENLTGLEQFAPLFAADALDVVQVGWGWGTTLALRVAAAAHSRDLPISPIGFTPAITPAATAMPNMLTIEVQDLAFPLGLHVDQTIADGGFVLGDAPGNGISLDEPALAALAQDPLSRAAADVQVRPGRAGLRVTAEDDRSEDRPPRLP
ncbi:L-alanine-DL-glutamate epimerase-like enolase superfamily enzyme [Motilibacter rhizosphaerae]|uniref:L-alanine-DL-glutamate epimerase-like enolase superfamily enzyme n=1 Tax=Motilibacter rhizosphaerae TaxID=598652 RepID=A0A4Q7NWR0_9ACTN|nr:mandelate racemase/muconate lactonizing enzyme family protein [Motilibacter rhizosphaerae]RZS91665.1 L-alanine-DL-glutamate epimerase-like enolase superfamily enzyme [Motilibacter rhizosphaerae]